MKFTYALVALVAAVSQAQPVAESDAEVKPSLVTVARSLDKRADVVFTVYTSGDCGTGGTTISASGNGAKGDFSTAQHSVKVSSIGSAYHLSMYQPRAQGASPNLRLTTSNIGDCWTYSTGWLSYGLYNS